MKTLRLNIAAFAIAGLFSLGAHAGDLSNMDYEDYVQSSVWPTDDLGASNTHTGLTNVDSINDRIKQYPTAAGTDELFVPDLFGNDIYSQ